MIGKPPRLGIKKMGTGPLIGRVPIGLHGISHHRDAWQSVEQVLRSPERGIVRPGKDETAGESVDSSRISDAARTDKTRWQAESTSSTGC